MDQVKEKRIAPSSVRLDEPLRNLVHELIKQTKAEDFSDYVRGLIVADALQQKLSIRGIKLPGWIVGTRVNASILSAQQQLSQSLETDATQFKGDHESKSKTRSSRKTG